jgi:hypothetical protein
MNRVRCIAVAVAVCAVALAVQPVSAQSGPRASYQPSVPTLSTWLNLYQRNSGVVDNYHTFVRPEKQLQDTLRQQNSMIEHQGEGIHGLTGQVKDLQQGRSAAHPTGAASVFMDYGHYYDLKSSSGPLRPSASRVQTRRSR